jgi:hypothetical protein
MDEDAYRVLKDHAGRILEWLMEVSFGYVAELLPDVIELQFAIDLGST